MNNIVYAVPINQKAPGQSQIYRHPDAVKQLWKPKFNTMQLVWNESLKRFPQKNCLEDFTYSQVDSKISKLGSWIVQNNHKVVYIHSKNRLEWTLVDIACWKYGIINVPLYDTLGKQALDYTFRLVEGTLIFSSKQAVQSLIKNAPKQNKLSTVVLLDEIDNNSLQTLHKMNLKIVLLKQIISEKTSTVSPRKVNPDDVISYIFTSGTTGVPKGAILTHQNFATQPPCCSKILQFTENDVLFSYLPLAHIFERINEVYIIAMGGQIRFGTGNPADFIKDVQRIKPTYLPIVPRLMNMIYEILRPMKHAKPERVKQAFKAKRQARLHGIKISQFEDVFKPANQLFGGRLRLLITGSAPISEEVLSFFKEVLDASILEGYGQTQTSSVSSVTSQFELKSGHVGGLTQSIQLKLVDIPEMNYFSTQKEPSGQICYRGYSIFKGYYKDEKNTLETIDKDGWHHTGDVGRLLPGGALKIIDRKKNIFKLSQGEYVAPQKIQNIYKQNPVVSDVFLYGDSFKNYNVAIVVPNLDVLASKGIKGSLQEICKNTQAINMIKEMLQETGKKANLFGFQQAKKIHLSHQPFQNIGILTNTMKLQRHEAKQFFKQHIQKLYDQK